jgi:hypothetical protein
LFDVAGSSPVIKICGKEKAALAGRPFFLLAEWTGLEPATPGVTGRYSNQLNYHSKMVGADGIEPPTLAL